MTEKLETTLDLAAVGRLYCELMEEILVRDELISWALAGNLPTLPAMATAPAMHATATAEFCFLQLRMICECLAIACLAAHGDIKEARSKDILKQYKADWIMNRLEQLHPKFYPVPSKQILDENGRPTELVPIVGPYLTKRELAKLYHESGGYLHRGSLEKVSESRLLALELEMIKVWGDRIWSLLEHHCIQTIQPDFQIYALMKDKSARRAQVAFSKRGADGRFHVVQDVRAI